MTETLDIKTLAATKTWGRGRVYDSIAETIGHTPLRVTHHETANPMADIIRLTPESDRAAPRAAGA